jgi:hypothetical protein
VNAFALIEPMIEVSKVDPKLAWLARAAARFELVRTGKMDIDTAFDGLVVCLSCCCSRETTARWESDYPAVRRRQQRAPRPTPQATIEAIMYGVRAHGVAALKEPANAERLRRCDAAARAEINRRIAALQRLAVA